MDKDRILGVLRQHEPELKAAGITHLCLFGSVARGDSGAASDVDLLFECDEPGDSHTLLQIYGSQEEFGRMLGCKIHLSSRQNLRRDIRDQALAETIDVF